MRDKNLDRLKGLAIILVVIGHTIQSSDPQFDDNFIFRFIYSFHMPMFVLLSGASASFWIENLKSCPSPLAYLEALANRVLKSAIYLLVPFTTWSGILYWRNDSGESISAFSLKVINSVDFSLWFLPVIFWCVLYVSFGLGIIQIIKSLSKNGKYFSNYLIRVEMQIIIIFILWVSLRNIIPDFLGTGMANTFHGGLFMFFLMGILMQVKFRQSRKLLLPVIITVGFLALVPFWSRIGANHFTTNVPGFLNNYYIGAFFTVTVAILGSLAFYFLGNYLFYKTPKSFNGIIENLGTHTLGIYAMHTYFLTIKPYVVLPLAISLFTSTVIEKTPVLRTFFLGKT